ETHHNARFTFAFVVGYGVFVVGLADEGEHGAINPRARLDHMWHETLLRLFIEEIERLAADVLMLSQVVIGAISDAFEFLPAERKIVFDVVGALGIKGAIGIRD